MSDNNISTERGRFRLLKFFAFASLAVLVAFSVPFSLIISRNTKEIILKSYENYALLLGQNLDHQIYQNFSIPVVSRYGQIRLRDQEQFQLMDKVVRGTIHSFKIDLVNIYDINKGVIAYSTDERLLGKKVVLGDGFKAATLGQASSKVIKGGGDIWGIGVMLSAKETKLRTFLPFKGLDPFSGKNYVMGVFELIQDLTEEYKEITRFTYVTFGLSTLIMALIFLSLLLVVRRAEAIMEQRAEEQRQWQAQLDQAERLAELGRMVAAISHEIKNPLGIISSTAELLQSSTLRPQEQKDLTEILLQETKRLNTILSEFLDFARPKVPELKEHDIREVLERNLSFIEQEAHRSGIEVIREIPPYPAMALIDSNSLHQAVLNILINAIQAMKDGGTLRVGISENKKSWHIQVADTGMGISEEILPRIFEPFFTTKEKGTGLGLSIVQKIIRSMNGDITVKSKVGEGTVFTISLPKLKEY